MLKIAKDDDERLFYLGSALEGLRGTFFRQAMFAEFELRIHEEVEKGNALSGDALTKIYGEILRRYHGDAEGVLKIDELVTVEWAYIPHFYRNFYVFQYATSIAASQAFAAKILAHEPGAVDTYLGLLKAGGSDYPYELVKKAGVDLGDTGAVPGARAAHEHDHGPDRGDPRQAREVGATHTTASRGAPAGAFSRASSCGAAAGFLRLTTGGRTVAGVSFPRSHRRCT